MYLKSFLGASKMVESIDVDDKIKVFVLPADVKDIDAQDLFCVCT